jgi:hypothetical protein
MNSVQHWEGNKDVNSEKGDVTSVDVKELERSQTVSVEREEFLVSDYARDVAVKVNMTVFCEVYFSAAQLTTAGRYYQPKTIRHSLL